MARRESQGLTITLIVFVMLTIILAVTTIAFWNKSKGLTEQNNSLQTQKSESDRAASTAVDQASRLKSWLGFAENASIEEIEQQKDRDMNTYARAIPEVQRNYKDVPAALFTALQQRNGAVADLRQQLNQARDEFDQSKAQLQKSLDDANAIQAQTEAELRKARDDFATDREKLNAEKDTLVAQLQQVRGELQTLEDSTRKQLDALENDLKNQTLVINQRDEQLRQVTTESFDVPDGKVLWVNNRLGTAYVNLGSADGLRSQVTFSVYAVDANNLARQEKKGSIEITRVVNDHMAEGKITSDKISDPILTGDVVFTPLWNARSALHFGLVGFMDIDGDGRNDRALIKRLIQLNNGTVDIEDAGGEVVGSITSHTRYLIRGDEPAVGDTEEETSSQAAQDAWSKIIKEANSFGVEQMSVEKLLDYIGYDGEKRTIPLGTAARPDDFQPKNGPPHGQGSVFRERVPR